MAAQIITTVVTPATSYDLTTLEEVMDELDLPEVENSTLLGRWITQASKTAAAYCNRVFVLETVKDEFWPQRDPWPWVIPGGLRPLQLTRWPITSVASVIEDGTTLTVNTDFRIDTDKGQLIRLDSNGYPTRWPALAIAVQYAAGYATIPAPVVDAVIRMIVGRWYRKGRDPGIKSESADGTWSASYWFTAGPDSSTGHLTSDVEGLLDAYRVPVMVA